MQYDTAMSFSETSPIQFIIQMMDPQMLRRKLLLYDTEDFGTSSFPKYTGREGRIHWQIAEL